MADVLAFLDSHGIRYVLHEHPPVFTCEEAAVHCAHVPGLPSKNLFLTDDSGGRWLVVLPSTKRLDTKRFRSLIGAGKVRFGTPAELKEALGLEPGSVTPLGLLNDAAGVVRVIVDRDVWDADVVNFHPNTNTASLEITREMFHALFIAMGRDARIENF